MRIRRKTTITAETERILTIRRRGIDMQDWCEGCGEQVEMLRLESASTVTGLSMRAICRLAEAHEIHFLETPGGALLICLNSLTRQGEANSLHTKVI